MPNDAERLRFWDQRERNVFERLMRWWVGGGVVGSTQSVSATSTLVLSTYTTVVDVSTSGGNVTVTLPAAADSTGKRVIITKTVAANTLTVASSDLINGAASVAWATQWQSASYISNGTTWRVG